MDRSLGLRGPIGKTDERRQRRNKLTPFVLAATAIAPAPPPKMLKVTREWWATYWSSELAKATREAHLPMVRRLFQRYDERERSYNTVRKDGRVTEGSTGQKVIHPLLKYIDNCDSEIRQLEDRLGLSPRGMAQLGANFAQAQRSLDDLNHSLETDDDDSDPRIEAVG